MPYGRIKVKLTAFAPGPFGRIIGLEGLTMPARCDRWSGTRSAAVSFKEMAMRSFLVGILALAGLVTDVLPASAAWDNVFQPTLFWRRRTTSSYVAPPVVVGSSPVVVASAAPCP